MENFGKQANELFHDIKELALEGNIEAQQKCVWLKSQEFILQTAQVYETRLDCRCSDDVTVVLKFTLDKEKASTVAAALMDDNDFCKAVVCATAAGLKMLQERVDLLSLRALPDCRMEAQLRIHGDGLEAFVWSPRKPSHEYFAQVFIVTLLAHCNCKEGPGKMFASFVASLQVEHSPCLKASKIANKTIYPRSLSSRDVCSANLKNCKPCSVQDFIMMSAPRAARANRSQSFAHLPGGKRVEVLHARPISNDRFSSQTARK